MASLLTSLAISRPDEQKHQHDARLKGHACEERPIVMESEGDRVG